MNCMESKQKPKQEKLLISVKEACEMTGVSDRTMRDLAYELNIEVKIGKRTLIHKKKLIEWIDQQVS